MNPTFALGALLLMASLTIASPTPVDPPETPARADLDCDFIDIDDDFPFVHIDLTCPPIPPGAAAGF